MDFDDDEPAELLKALAPKCVHATATKAFYRREDGSFLAVCQQDGLTAEFHVLPPGFIPDKGASKGVEIYRYDKKQARIDMAQEIV